MLQLYTTDYCYYCKKVEAYLEGAGIPYEERNASKNSEYRDDIINKGGRMQVPYLVDTENGTEMYESEDIIEYIASNYAGTVDKNS